MNRSTLPVFWILAAVLLALQLLRPMHDMDIFWQLKLGEVTRTQGMTSHEPFAANKQTEPFVPVAWLGQVVYSVVRSIGSWVGLRIFDTLVWFGGFLLVAAHLRRQTGAELPAVGALLLSWAGAIPFASLRPQSFALLSLALLIVVVRCRWSTLWATVVGTAILILWQNLHPSASIGLVYLTSSAAGEWWSYWFRSGPKPTLTRVLLVPIAALTLFATPAGFAIFEVTATNQARCTSDVLRIAEWLPLWDNFPADGRLGAATMLLVAATILSMRRKNVLAVDLLPALAFAVLTILIFRFMLFWAVVVIPVLVQAFAPTTATDTKPHGKPWLPVVLMLAALIPGFLKGPNFDPRFPFAGVKELQTLQLQGNIYTNRAFGGMLIDNGYPEWRVSHDGRYYLYSLDELRMYSNAMKGEVPVSELVATYQPVAFFLNPVTDQGLIKLLRAAEWTVHYEDAYCVVLVW